VLEEYLKQWQSFGFSISVRSHAIKSIIRDLLEEDMERMAVILKSLDTVKSMNETFLKISNPVVQSNPGTIPYLKVQVYSFRFLPNRLAYFENFISAMDSKLSFRRRYQTTKWCRQHLSFPISRINNNYRVCDAFKIVVDHGDLIGDPEADYKELKLILDNVGPVDVSVDKHHIVVYPLDFNEFFSLM
jgi:hypothetical protein